ncbi:MAG: hypothetical protein P0S96_02555 [Simkaniaceae bacterium]|nr:hypothetical protein [Candidatus Sacchlamyda saccharinae]
MSATVDCNQFLLDYLRTLQEVGALRHTATDAKIASGHAQAVHDRTWPIPFRSERSDLRERVKQEDCKAAKHDAAATAASKELDRLRGQMRGCQFTGQAAKAWTWLGGTS